jgi:hypothetical protein
MCSTQVPVIDCAVLISAPLLPPGKSPRLTSCAVLNLNYRPGRSPAGGPRPAAASPGPAAAGLGCGTAATGAYGPAAFSLLLLSRMTAYRSAVPCGYRRLASRDGFCAGQRPDWPPWRAGRRARTAAASPGWAWRSGQSVGRAWQDRTRPSSPRAAERGERSGNVPRRSPHPLKVFPRVQ